MGIKGRTGGLVGNSRGFIIDSYYDINTIEKDNIGRGGRTTAEMKQKATFTDWNFKEIWGISDTINCGYPYLLNFD
jgi:hypothetical protein